MTTYQILSLVLSVLGGLATLGVAIYRIGNRIGALEIKVNTVWDFIMRRAALSGLSRGLFAKESAMKITEQVKAAYKTLHPDLCGLYQRLASTNPTISDNALALEIERVFGERLIAEVCPVLDTHLGECLVIAAELSKEPIA